MLVGIHLGGAGNTTLVIDGSNGTSTNITKLVVQAWVLYSKDA